MRKTERDLEFIEKSFSWRLKEVFRFLIFFAALLTCISPAMAQTDTATLQGTVVDPQGAVVPGASITITNSATLDSRPAKSSPNGTFAFVGLSPGTYTLNVEHAGFQALSLPKIMLNVGGRDSVTLHLRIGSESQTVTVQAADSALQTTDVGVSTVINQQEIANMPLNGRSFQDLILLVPGVTTTGTESFSVNSQSTNSNSFSVDGVSVNASSGNAGFGGGGETNTYPVATVLNTTQNIVPVDDLQEFRVETSSYSAEFGGAQGGQFIFNTRSGTNQFHGGAFEYFRNTVLDANDWFDNYYGTPLQPLHQNDFGGFLGGPVIIPKLYNGKRKTFFFADDESLRLTEPIAAYIGYTPNTALRAQTSGAVQAVMNSFPVANGPDLSGGNPATTPGLGEYISAYSEKGGFDSYNLRLDQVFSSNEAFFIRVSNTPNNIAYNNFADVSGYQDTTRTYTAGLTSAITSHLTNELRVNFNHDSGDQYGNVQQQSGAQPINLLTNSGYPSNLANYDIGFDYYFSVGGAYIADYRGVDSSRQFNFTDAISWVHGSHNFKLGGNFRRNTSTNLPESPLVTYYYYTAADLIANSLDYAYIDTYVSTYPQTLQYGLYAEDNWHPKPRFTLSYGLRWDIDPLPTVRRGNSAPSLSDQGQNDPSDLALLPLGTPPFHTDYYAIAPRLGATYLFNQGQGHQTQLRAGGGLFYDPWANQQAALNNFFYGPGTEVEQTFCPAGCDYTGAYSYPLAPQYRDPLPQYPPTAPYTTTLQAYPSNWAPPLSFQGNVALEQQFSGSNALTLNYVTALGRKGDAAQEYYEYPENPNFEYVEFNNNKLRSNYNSLQVVFQHRVTNGLFAYAAYTWAHTVTDNQFNLFTPYVSGPAYGDLRHNFNAAVTWDIPFHSSKRLERALLAHWGTDLRLFLHSGIPYTLFGQSLDSPQLGGAEVSTGVDRVPGVPVYLYGTYNGKNIPGGKQLNPAAFTTAAAGTPGDVPINYYRGFGQDQVNFAFRRTFPVYRRLNLQFRAEAFNIFNHPNFGSPDDYLPDVTFGQPTEMLNTSLGGGTGSIYSTGGPRNLQLALKLIF